MLSQKSTKRGKIMVWALENWIDQLLKCLQHIWIFNDSTFVRTTQSICKYRKIKQQTKMGFDIILEAVYTNLDTNQRCFFLDGPAGTKKYISLLNYRTHYRYYYFNSSLQNHVF
jgi:hypothetical protein